MGNVQLSSQQNYSSYQYPANYQNGAVAPQAASPTAPLPSHPASASSFTSTPAYTAGRGVSAGYGQNAQVNNYAGINREPPYKFTDTGTTVEFQIHRTVVQPVEIQSNKEPVSYDSTSHTFQPLFTSRQRPSSQESSYAPPSSSADWQENKPYQTGDEVMAGNGRTYAALRSTTGEGPWSHTAPGSDYPARAGSAAWADTTNGRPYSGTWSETKPYQPGDIVTAGNGRTYAALRSTTGEGPWSHTAPGSPYASGPHGPAWTEYGVDDGSSAPPQAPVLALDPVPPRPFAPGEFPPGLPSSQIQAPDPFVPGEFARNANTADVS